MKLPVSWQMKKIGEVCSSIVPGRNKPKEFSGTIPWVTTPEITSRYIPGKSQTLYLSDYWIKQAGAKKVPSGSVIMACVGDLGLVAIATEEVVLNQQLHAFVCPPSVHNEYCAYALEGQKTYMYKIASTTTIPYLNKTNCESIKILLPPLPEQKAIADLLSTWDEAIEKTERLILAKERRLDAYARDLFDCKNEGKYEGWKVVKLKTVLTEHGNKSTGVEEVYSVSVHKGLVNQVEHLGRSFSAANTDKYNCVHYGDIVYTKSPTGDFPLGIVKQSYTKEDVIVSPLYGVFSPRTFELGIVLDFYFSSPARARNYLFSIIQKGAKNTIAITNKTFLSKALHLPIDDKAQKAVAEFVYAAREEIDLLKQLVDKYKTQKRGLMQKMLTGEWRVKSEIINQYKEV